MDLDQAEQYVKNSGQQVFSSSFKLVVGTLGGDDIVDMHTNNHDDGGKWQVLLLQTLGGLGKNVSCVAETFGFKSISDFSVPYNILIVAEIVNYTKKNS